MAALDSKALEKEPLIFFALLLTSIALFLAFLLIIAVSNLLVLRSLVRYNHSGRQPFISVLIPARNEEEVIGRCVQSLLSQDYPNFEVRVLDDDSSDGTWTVLQNLAIDDSRLKITRGKLLPAGWLGKLWACHQLSLQAEGEMLLFTDADTVHRPSTLRHAAAAMETEDADLITALPQQIMGSFLEKLIMPFSYWVIMCFLPLVVAFTTQNTLFSAATGQFMLFRRSAYEKTGGFEAIKEKVVDDVELCKRIRSHGLRWRLMDGHDSYSVRQYSSAMELIEGHTKNLFAEFNNNAPVLTFIWLWILLVFLAPIAGLFTGILIDGTAGIVFWLSVACILVSLAIWIIACMRFRFPLYLPLFYPLSVLIMAMLSFSSMILNFGKKATWKGRVLPGS
ncbi:MAG: glycosyltransferase [Dehalococcoidia bacterium]|nr:glycosyltransferase [Dehalococcoidia bacterium]MDD5493661.1 glycosyltransferase [Dehalococcoidia bacterium]